MYGIMENKKYLLTVCIPTYNRPSHIQKQVRDVLAQLTEGVRLLVMDNHSDVPTESYFTKEELAHFTVIRHKTNIGADANNAHCLEMVDTGWVWLLGDDDRIRPDAIEVILNLISEHPDCCYINTANKRTELVESFNQFLAYFKIRGAYGKAFFQSACLFNMDEISSSLIWYYNFLSTQMGQFYLVLKHMELVENSTCFFTTENLIVDKEPGDWDPLMLIINSSLIIDRFQYCKAKMKSTIFFSLGNMYFDSIAVSSISFLKKLGYIRYVIRKLGFLNTIRYNYIALGYYCINQLMPNNIVKKIHRVVAAWYNELVK